MKSYTNLEQSKKLAEILPLESADMWFANGLIVAKTSEEPKDIKGVFPCWSLAALLDVLEGEIDGEMGETYQLNIEKDGTWWNVWYEEQYDEADPIETESTEDLVDACYDMIIKLNGLNLL